MLNSVVCFKVALEVKLHVLKHLSQEKRKARVPGDQVMIHHWIWGVVGIPRFWTTLILILQLNIPENGLDSDKSGNPKRNFYSLYKTNEMDFHHQYIDAIGYILFLGPGMNHIGMAQEIAHVGSTWPIYRAISKFHSKGRFILGATN